MGLVTIASLGPADAGRSSTADRDAGQADMAARASPRALVAPPISAAAARGAVVLRSPRRSELGVTTARLTVDGYLRVQASKVRLSLEARHEQVSQTILIDLSDPHGGIRPEHRPSFHHEFDLPFIRPAGEMTILVIAYGADGVPMAGARIPVEIGPLLESADDGPR